MTDIFTEGVNNNPVKKQSGLKKFAIVFAVVLLSFLAVYTYLSIDSVRSRMELSKSQTKGDVIINLSSI